MQWFLTDDITQLNKDYIQSVDDSIEKVLVLPSLEEVRECLRMSKSDFFKSAIVSNRYPYSEFENIFILKKIKRSEIRNSQQKHYEEDETKILKERLGLSVSYSDLTLEDASGAFELIQWAHRAKVAKEKGFVIKPVFLLGVAGIGKSRFVACYAGEQNVPMIDMNLAKIMEAERPITQLNETFEYLSDTNIPCVLRIDEIAQMLTKKELIGQMLTILNELNGKNGYRLNGVIFATENNIRELIKTNNQFFRIGRWGEKFFVHYLKEEAQKEVMRYYNKRYSVALSEDQINEIYYKSQAIYKEQNLVEERSVYVPSEIDYLFERLTFYDTVTSEAIEEEIRYVIPQYKSASEGVASLLGDAQKNYFRTI